MELFSEIYSAYYMVVSQILSEAPVSEKNMNELINRNAFSESALYLIPQLKNDWALLSKNNGLYHSVLKNKPVPPLTLLEKRWIKSLLCDSRVRLFLDDDTISQISNMLADIKPLYNQKHFFFFDRFSDGDNFDDADYICNFRKIHSAIISKTILKITFKTSKSLEKTGFFLPLKLEYSPKNNKFRVYSALIRNKRVTDMGLINISRILSIENTSQIFSDPIDTDALLQRKRSEVPVCVEVSSERNGIERFMMEFAGYEKHTESDEQSGICTAYIWYNVSDETELLIRLLSFGPVLEIKSPPYFRKLAKERIDRQYNMIINKEKSPEKS